MDFVVFGRVCSTGHSFLGETGYNCVQRFEIACRALRFGAKAGDCDYEKVGVGIDRGCGVYRVGSRG